MSAIDEVICAAASGPIDRARAVDLCAQSSIQLEDLYNQVALEVAVRFDCGEMKFTQADAVMNEVFRMMIEDASRFGDGFRLAEPAYSIYLAFDSGEFDRRDGSDPVEKYTRPEIRRLVERWRT